MTRSFCLPASFSTVILSPSVSESQFETRAGRSAFFCPAFFCKTGFTEKCRTEKCYGIAAHPVQTQPTALRKRHARRNATGATGSVPWFP